MKTSSGIMLLWRFAAREAERSDHEFIEPEHFVEAMTRGESLTNDTMLKIAISDEAVRRAIASELANARNPKRNRQTRGWPGAALVSTKAESPIHGTDAVRTA